MKKYIIATVLIGVSFALSYAVTSTETTQVLTDDIELIDCAAITHPLKLGSRDVNTKGEVTVLQIYLSQAGFLETDPTGYFGTVTRRAVENFQRAQGFSPVGNVGPATRARIKALSCTSTNSGGTSTIDEGKPVKEKEIAYTCPNGKTIYVPNNDEKRKYVEKYCGTGTVDKPVACTMEYRSCADGSAMPRDLSNCKWLEDKCPKVKPISEDVNVLRIYLSGSNQASIIKENVGKETALSYCKEKMYAYQGRAIRCMWGEHDIYSSGGSATGNEYLNTLRIYSGSDQAFVEKESVSKEVAVKYCEEKKVAYFGRPLRCLWGGYEIYSSNPTPITTVVCPMIMPIQCPDGELVSIGTGSDGCSLGYKCVARAESVYEQIKCVFDGSSTVEQKCYGYVPAINTGENVMYFSCSGLGACAVDVKGRKGSTIKWSASCGESTSSTIDGTSKYINFKCTR